GGCTASSTSPAPIAPTSKSPAAAVPTSGGGAVITNVTATNSTAPSFVTVYPAATNQPVASNLHVDHVGQTIPNLVVGRLGEQGRVSMYSLTDLDLLFDDAGWFTGDFTPPSQVHITYKSAIQSHHRHDPG